MAGRKKKSAGRMPLWLYVLIVVAIALVTYFRTSGEAEAGDPQPPAASAAAQQTPADETLTVRFLDVGQGDSILLACGDETMLIDGGPEQLRFAQESIHEVPMEKYPAMFGLAKRLEEIYLPDRDDPIRLDEHSEALRLIQRVRDEAHRFAITHHRGLRTRRSVASRLEEIPGIGATRRRALLTHYANLDAMKQATLDELRDVPGMNQPAAEAVYAFFHAEEGGSQRG